MQIIQNTYTEIILNRCEAAKDIPKEYLPLFAGMLDNVVVAEECEGEEEIELVPIPPKN